MLRWVAPLCAAVLASACAAPEAPPVTRVVGGERREQRFVSPYQYEWYVRGEIAATEGDWAAAAEAFRRARAGPTDDPYLVARQADVLDRAGRHAQAARVLAEGRALDPRAEAVWLAEARIAERHDAWPEALRAYHRAEQAAPRSAEAPLALAHLLEDRGDAGRAAAVLERYLRRVPSASPAAWRARLRLALLRGDRPAAVRAARSLLRLAPARASLIRRTAELALERGDPVMAAALLEPLGPTGAPVALRVRALTAAGRHERAEALLAITPPEAVGGLAAQARLYLVAGLAAKAEETAEAALALGPDPEASLVAGEAELAQAKWVEAAEHLARVPPGASGHAEARATLAKALEAGGLSALATELQNAEPGK